MLEISNKQEDPALEFRQLPKKEASGDDTFGSGCLRPVTDSCWYIRTTRDWPLCRSVIVPTPEGYKGSTRLI